MESMHDNNLNGASSKRTSTCAIDSQAAEKPRDKLKGKLVKTRRLKRLEQDLERIEMNESFSYLTVLT